MRFVAALALGICLLVALPLLAHLVSREGRKPLPFPLVRLVRNSAVPAERSRSLADHWLLLLRVLMILCLSLLAAVPMVQCNRPTLSRHQGGSIALSIVLDDSASMRIRTKQGRTRFELAKEGALALLDQLHVGDTVSVVLAGTTARLLVSATQDLTFARDRTQAAQVSDRSTDLTGAVHIADSTLRGQPQKDHRIALLSDLAERLQETAAPLWAPLPELTERAQDCGVISALKRDSYVEVTVACSTDPPSPPRRVGLVRTQGKGAPLAVQPIDATRAQQNIILGPVVGTGALSAVLLGHDDNPANDEAPVFEGSDAAVVATVSDYAAARAAIGGQPVLDQALSSIDIRIQQRPWPGLPEVASMYEHISLLLLDDPQAYSPEARASLTRWLENGGVAAAFLGPSAESVPVGATLWPFADGLTDWIETAPASLAADSMQWLGDAASGWSDIGARARLVFSGGNDPGVAVRGRWGSGDIAITQRNVGKGAAWTVGLPASTEVSDLAIRPAFLAFIRHLLRLAQSNAVRVSQVGIAWQLPRTYDVSSPAGAKLAPVHGAPAGDCTYVPDQAGIYRITRPEAEELRLVHLDPREISETTPQSLPLQSNAPVSDEQLLDTSPYWAMLIALLVAAEGVLLLIRRSTSTPAP